MAREWIEWSGGSNPLLHNTLVYPRYRDGIEATKVRRSHELRWEHEGLPDDIVGFAVLEQTDGA